MARSRAEARVSQEGGAGAGVTAGRSNGKQKVARRAAGSVRAGEDSGVRRSGVKRERGEPRAWVPGKKTKKRLKSQCAVCGTVTAIRWYGVYKGSLKCRACYEEAHNEELMKAHQPRCSSCGADKTCRWHGVGTDHCLCQACYDKDQKEALKRLHPRLKCTTCKKDTSGKWYGIGTDSVKCYTCHWKAHHEFLKQEYPGMHCSLCGNDTANRWYGVGTDCVTCRACYEKARYAAKKHKKIPGLQCSSCGRDTSSRWYGTRSKSVKCAACYDKGRKAAKKEREKMQNDTEESETSVDPPSDADSDSSESFKMIPRAPLGDVRRSSRSRKGVERLGVVVYADEDDLTRDFESGSELMEQSPRSGELPSRERGEAAAVHKRVVRAKKERPVDLPRTPLSKGKAARAEASPSHDTEQETMAVAAEQKRAALGLRLAPKRPVRAEGEGGAKTKKRFSQSKRKKSGRGQRGRPRGRPKKSASATAANRPERPERPRRGSEVREKDVAASSAAAAAGAAADAEASGAGLCGPALARTLTKDSEMNDEQVAMLLHQELNVPSYKRRRREGGLDVTGLLSPVAQPGVGGASSGEQQREKEQNVTEEPEPAVDPHSPSPPPPKKRRRKMQIATREPEAAVDPPSEADNGGNKAPPSRDTAHGTSPKAAEQRPKRAETAVDPPNSPDGLAMIALAFEQTPARAEGGGARKERPAGLPRTPVSKGKVARAEAAFNHGTDQGTPPKAAEQRPARAETEGGTKAKRFTQRFLLDAEIPTKLYLRFAPGMGGLPKLKNPYFKLLRMTPVRKVISALFKKLPEGSHRLNESEDLELLSNTDVLPLGMTMSAFLQGKGGGHKPPRCEWRRSVEEGNHSEVEKLIIDVSYRARGSHRSSSMTDALVP